MSKSPVVIVTVESDGKISVEAEGYKGTSCLEATRFIEDSLGTATGRKAKADMRQAKTKAANRQHLGRGGGA